MEHNYTPLYYSTPCQVKWFNIEHDRWEGGIGFQNYLIKGDGSIIPLDDILSEAVEHCIDVEKVVIELSWLDLNDTILGN